jgi:VanZ family protein
MNGDGTSAATPRSDQSRIVLLWYWGAVVGWIIVIGTFSSDTFSATNTGRYIDPFLRWLFPGITNPEIITAHTIIRKSAHFLEFFVLGCLVFWASRRRRARRWRAAWVAQALGIALICALGDEGRQALSPHRTASLTDSLVDMLGAVFSQLCIYASVRLRGLHPAGGREELS